MNKWLLINIMISIIAFFTIFKCYAGASGGDFAILFGNIIFGFLQILCIDLIFGFYKKPKGKLILVVIICQILELLFFIQWGYEVNQYLKK